MIHVHVEVGRNTRIAVEEISNISTFKDLQSEHKYANIPNCLHFVCKMFSYHKLKTLNCLQNKDIYLCKQSEYKL